MAVQKILLLTLVNWLYCCIIVSAKEVYIFGITPEKGLIGVKLDTKYHKNGRVDPITFPVEGVTILKDCKLISYDSFYNFVLVERDSGLIQQTALCQNGLYYHKPLLNTTSLVYLQDPEGWVCYNGKVNTFALYKSQMYFLVIGEFEDRWHRKTTKVELRIMKNCLHCGVTNITDFDTLGVFRSPYLFNCSERIAEVYNSRSKGDLDVYLKTGYTLKIIEENGYISFFFQVIVVRNSSGNDYQFVDMDFYHATSKGSVQLLHREKIPKHYARWKINAIGGLDYNDGELCWSTADRIFCGQFRDGRLYNSKMILYPGDSVSTRVCKGNRPNLLPIITGLSIIDVNTKDMSLVFGCYSQWIGVGGTGLITIQHGSRLNKHIYPIYIDHQSQMLQLGSLFSTTSFANYCEPYYDVPMCNHPNKPDVKSSKLKKNNETDIILLKKDSHYSQEAVYTIVHKSNDTHISVLDYADLYDSTIIRSKHDRDLFHEKGIGAGCKLYGCGIRVCLMIVSVMYVI